MQSPPPVLLPSALQPPLACGLQRLSHIQGWGLGLCYSHPSQVFHCTGSAASHLLVQASPTAQTGLWLNCHHGSLPCCPTLWLPHSLWLCLHGLAHLQPLQQPSHLAWLSSVAHSPMALSSCGSDSPVAQLILWLTPGSPLGLWPHPHQFLWLLL